MYCRICGTADSQKKKKIQFNFKIRSQKFLVFTAHISNLERSGKYINKFTQRTKPWANDTIRCNKSLKLKQRLLVISFPPPTLQLLLLLTLVKGNFDSGLLFSSTNMNWNTLFQITSSMCPIYGARENFTESFLRRF